jgi:hypothetical protein
MAGACFACARCSAMRAHGARRPQRTNTNTRARTHTHTRTRTRARAHARTRTRTHARTQHTHTNAHTHTRQTQHTNTHARVTNRAGRYLEQQAVLDAAEGLAGEAEALLAGVGVVDDDAWPGAAAAERPGAGGGPAAAGASAAAEDPQTAARAVGALAAAGLKCSAATYQSLARHLQVSPKARGAPSLTWPFVSLGALIGGMRALRVGPGTPVPTFTVCMRRWRARCRGCSCRTPPFQGPLASKQRPWAPASSTASGSGTSSSSNPRRSRSSKVGPQSPPGANSARGACSNPGVPLPQPRP